ncbi:hypothetical protein [Clostridium tetani]|uniref:hypothetical protein n=1 Tax=Clostridium tetani TaxID=1513 RepID=UPI0024A92473|nr:hypothetical protein [Clostridium tetani]
MFYKHTMSLYHKGKKYKDKINQVHYTKEKHIANFKCDIQPLTREKAEKVFGITQDCTNVIYMDLNPILIPNEHMLKRLGRTYEILRIIEWEEEEDPDFNYREVILNEIH